MDRAFCNFRQTRVRGATPWKCVVTLRSRHGQFWPCRLENERVNIVPSPPVTRNYRRALTRTTLRGADPARPHGQRACDRPHHDLRGLPAENLQMPARLHTRGPRTNEDAKPVSCAVAAKEPPIWHLPRHGKLHATKERQTIGHNLQASVVVVTWHSQVHVEHEEVPGHAPPCLSAHSCSCSFEGEAPPLQHS